MARFGRMSSAGAIECTIREISKQFNTPAATVSRVITNFIDNYDTLVSHQRGPKVESIPIAVQDAILD